MRTINIIAAVDEDFGFGKDGKIPWHYPEDFKFFKDKTAGSVCIMGRKTFEDLQVYAKGKQVLPGRECIVLTNTALDLGTRPNTMSIPDTNAWVYNNIHEAASVGDALDISIKLGGDVFFIGGEGVFDVGLKLADCVYITHVPGSHGCDRFFPKDSLHRNYQLYNSMNGSDGLVYKTYVHTIYGTQNPLN